MKFYLSHPIRGIAGKNATPLQMERNCMIATTIGHALREIFQGQEIYVPAEHEDFVLRAYTDHYLTEQQILEIDCSIIDSCEGVLVYVPESDTLQGGRKIEYDYAIAHNKPCVVFSTVEQVILYLTSYILKV